MDPAIDRTDPNHTNIIIVSPSIAYPAGAPACRIGSGGAFHSLYKNQENHRSNTPKVMYMPPKMVGE